MKRQIQKPGVRKWYGDDFLKLQNEIYRAVENAIIGSVDNIILAGINHTLVAGHHSWSEGYCKISGKICHFPGMSTTVDTIYLSLTITEIDNRDYGDGISKPTADDYKVHLSTTLPSSGDYIKLTGNDVNRLIVPFIDANGVVQRIHYLKYVKENFDIGEIVQEDVPAGELWLGKFAPFKIKSNQDIEINTLYIIQELYTKNIIVNGNITASGTVNVNKLIATTTVASKNTPKILIYVDSNGALIKSLGSVEILPVHTHHGNTGIYYIDVIIPTDAILLATVIGGTQSISAYRSSSQHPAVEIKNYNNNYMDSAYSLAVYY